MYELVKLAGNSYYIESPAKVGVILLDDKNVALIDSGNDKDAGKKILKVLTANRWDLKVIFNSHYHADHIGGNEYLQKNTGCKIYAPGIERDCICHPILEPALLYGGYPPKELCHKFLLAQPSDAELLTDDVLPNCMQRVDLPGHSFNMVGFRTQDNVVYLADCLSSAETLNKYQVGFLTNVEAYLQTLENVKQMRAKFFVPAHAAPCEEIEALAQLNIDKTLEIAEKIIEICTLPRTFEQILQKVFEIYNLQMTFEQHALVGSTIRSYLTWLKNKGKIVSEIDNNRVLWCRV